MRYWRTPGKGQRIVKDKCPGLVISIDKFTTEYTAEEHAYIHTWVGTEIRYEIYQHMYEGVVAASKTCCEFLIGVQALMLAWDGAIFAAHQRGAITGSMSPFDLIDFYDPQTPPHSTRPKFDALLLEACGCSDEQRRNTDIKIRERYTDYMKDIKRDLKIDQGFWDHVRDVFENPFPLVIPVPGVPVPNVPPVEVPITPPVRVPLAPAA